MSAQRYGALLARWGVWVALAVLVVYNVVATPRFVTWQTVQTNITQMSAIAILAVGMTFVIATAGIDLSIGSMMALSGALAGVFLVGLPSVTSVPGLGIALVVAVAIAAGLVMGSVNGFLVGGLGIQPIIATLVLLIAGRGVAQLITSGRLYTVDHPQVLDLGRGSTFGLPNQAWVMIAVIAVGSLVARYTTYGRYVVAVGGNEQAAGGAGVPVRRVKYAVYMASGGLAGLAAVLSIGVNGTVDTANLGLGWEFTVISAVVVGGTALSGGRPRLAGTLGGVALIQLLAFTLASHNIPKEVSMLVQAGVIVTAVALQVRQRR
jgi:ribose/xylose/arabinose/galactoside ABC-type transport system permease subunit